MCGSLFGTGGGGIAFKSGLQDPCCPQGGTLDGGKLAVTATATATAVPGRTAREARCAAPRMPRPPLFAVLFGPCCTVLFPSLPCASRDCPIPQQCRAALMRSALPLSGDARAALAQAAKPDDRDEGMHQPLARLGTGTSTLPAERTPESRRVLGCHGDAAWPRAPRVHVPAAARDVALHPDAAARVAVCAEQDAAA